MRREDLCGSARIFFVLFLLPAFPGAAFGQSGQPPLTVLPTTEVVGTSPLPGLGIDRDKIPANVQSLPAPDATNMLRDDAVVAPTTPVEERLVAIVAATLGLDAAQVGIDDNFFLLGGHSLSGTQVITRIADMFGVELSLHTLFAAPTIVELSLEVERLILAKLDAMSEDEIQSLLAYPSDGSAVSPVDHAIEEGAMEAQP